MEKVSPKIIFSAVSFVAKPSPPRTLNSLEESGIVRLTVDFKNPQQNKELLPVKSVSAKITNNTKKSKNESTLEMTKENELKRSNDDFEDTDIPNLSTELEQKESCRWYGEIAISCSWLEGGSKTFERTGSFSPYYDDNLFTMSITYTTDNNDSNSNKKFVAEINSTDVFHWKQE